jgi:hypothetical protein
VEVSAPADREATAAAAAVLAADRDDMVWITACVI